MSTPSDSEIQAPVPRPESRPVDLSRRKLGMGLGMSAIFTLTSRPVLAAVECAADSAVTSGNTSTNGPALTCTGLTPAQWVAHAQNTNPMDPNNPTQNGFPGGNVQFHAMSLFMNGSQADWGPGARLYEVMAHEDTINSAEADITSRRGGFLGSSGRESGSDTPQYPNPANPISMEFAATLLNIRDGRIPSSVLNEVELIGMWTEWMDTGMYAPTAGVTWSGEQIVQYLRMTQG